MKQRSTSKHFCSLLSCFLIILLLVPVAAKAQNKVNPPVKIAVLPWAMNQTLEKGGGVAMAAMINEWLKESQLVTVLEDQELLQRMTENDELDFGCMEKDCLLKICQTLAVDLVIKGEMILTDVGSGPLYFMKMISVDADGNQAVYEDQVSGTEEDFLNLLAINIENLFITPLRPVAKKVLTEGSVNIESRPPGAEVYFDQANVGYTPLYLPKVKAGRHTIKLMIAGYEIWSDDHLTIKGGESKTVIGELMLQLGGLIVNTSPPGGKVLLEQEEMGKTPLDVSVPSGEYNLEIERLGFENHRQKVTVRPGSTVNLDIILSPGLSKQEKAELKKLTRLKAAKKGKLTGVELVSYNKLMARKKRREADRNNQKKAGRGAVAAKLAALTEKHRQACAEKGMVFVQNKEITLADISFSASRFDPTELRRGFCIDPTEVAIDEFRTFLPTFISSEYSHKDNHPVTRVTYEQAKGFCQSKKKRLCARNEWTQACRGKEGNTYFYGKKPEPGRCRSDLKLVDGPVAVGTQKKCRNQLGIYDMSGNVWEWTEDKHFPNTRVVRGGSWVDKATPCDYRGAIDPATKDDTFGFRCCADYLLNQ